MKKKLPNKAKLINGYGFYRIVKLPKFVKRINYPTTSNGFLEFQFCDVVGGYVIYKQV